MKAAKKNITRKRRVTTKAKQKPEKKDAKKDVAASYNAFKQFGGRRYSGMTIGRSHHWHYDQGDWKETKITPDLWEIAYTVKKRRVGHAPEGSGAAVGTGYHWFILAHQEVTKLNANDYSTSMNGIKYQLAYKQPSKGKWSATAHTQRKHLVKFMKEMVAQLEKEPIPIDIECDGVTYKGEAVPIPETCHDGVCDELDITLNDEHIGIIRCAKSGWKLDGADKKLVQAIGNEIVLWYE